MSTMDEIQTRSLGPIGQIPIGEGRTFRVDGQEIAVFRTRQGELFATQARCPHRGGPLADGLLGSGVVVCPFHAYAFDLATGAPVRNGCAALRTYPVEVTGEGELKVTVRQGGVALCG